MGKFEKLKSLFASFKGSEVKIPDERHSFEPQNDVERWLMDAASSEQARRNFVRELKLANLYAATPEAPEAPEARVLKAAETIQILNVATPEGTSIPAIFTSEVRLMESFGAGTGYIAVEGKTLLEIVQNSGAWINPGSQYSVVYSARDLANILGVPERRVIQAETKLLLGSPTVVPHELVASLKFALGADGRIKEAYLALAMWPDAADTSWYLEIESDHDPDSLGETLGLALHDAPSEGKPIDVVVRSSSEMARLGIRILPAGLN